ncbi:MAG: protein kinase [Nannocystaceae bacterium]
MSDELDSPRISALLQEGRVDEGDVVLEREALLSTLFPSQVTRPKLGRYDVLEIVGEGGMGTVFAAYDARLDRRVAIKRLRRASVDRPERHARLLREAKALARLSHPNIVTIHEVWEERDEVLLAMEFVQGQDLAKWQQQRPRPWTEVLHAYRQAGAGLAAAHDAGLVYRDFKPHNVIRRDEDGVVKLLDFGLARIADEPVSTAVDADASAASDPGPQPDRVVSDHLTRPGSIMGTPAYMAPEQLEGIAADPRSDQFSYCAALWETLYGQLPHTRVVVGGGVVETEPRVELPREHGVPAWIRRVLERGLATDPGDRYPSMHVLLRELGRDPAVRRRRMLGVLAAGTVMVMGGLAIAELRAGSASQCVELKSSWDGPRRQAARRGVTETGGPSSEQSLTLLEPRLDHHAVVLSQTRTEACESHRRELIPDEHYALQVACLDRRQAAFDELVDLLGRADQAAVDNANRAITALPSPQVCTNTEALLADQLPPDDPEVAARVDELREQLARAGTEESAGLHAEAEQRALAVLDQARALDYDPLRAEALVRQGSARMQAGHADSLAILDEALWVSISTDQRRVAAEAAAKRIFARVELDDRSADATEAIALARSLVDRSGAADWRIRWLLDNNTAVALERRGEQSAALEAYGRALDHIPVRQDVGTFERAATLYNMAPVQLRLGRADAAIRSARGTVEQLTDLFGSEHPRLRGVEGTLASLLWKSGRLSEAQATFEAVLDRYPEPDRPLWMLLESGRVALARGRPSRARIWCDRARPRLGREPSPTGLDIMFAVLEAEILASEGDASAVEALERMRGTVTKGPRVDLEIGMAKVLLRLGRAPEARLLLLEVLAQPQLGEWNRVAASLALGRALVAQQRFDAAQSRLSAILEGPAGPQLVPIERAEALGASSSALLGLDRIDDALSAAQQALEVLDGADRDGEPVRLALEAQRNANDAARASEGARAKSAR